MSSPDGRSEVFKKDSVLPEFVIFYEIVMFDKVLNSEL